MSSSLNIKKSSDQIRQSAETFIDAFIHSDRPRFLFGNNVFAATIIKLVSIDGIIDETADTKTVNNIACIKLENVPADALVLVLSGGSPLTALSKVRAYGLDCLHYFSFYKYADLPLVNIPFEGNTAAEYARHADRFDRIFKLLADKQSKVEFEKVLNLRISLDVETMQGFTARENEQYFEDFLDLQANGESFVDVGAFDGFTTESFIQLCPNYQRIDLFEPDPHNILLAQQRLHNRQQIFYHQLGLSDHTGEARFSPAGSTSSISKAGAIRIKLDTLDNILSEPVSFIKMDIEGAESEALNGAKNLIKRSHPRLAIAVYHHPDDFWQIPQTVLSVRNDYDLYFRHYTESLYESVMFFIPN